MSSPGDLEPTSPRVQQSQRWCSILEACGWVMIREGFMGEGFL